MRLSPGSASVSSFAHPKKDVVNTFDFSQHLSPFCWATALSSHLSVHPFLALSPRVDFPFMFGSEMYMGPNLSNQSEFQVLSEKNSPVSPAGSLGLLQPCCCRCGRT